MTIANTARIIRTPWNDIHPKSGPCPARMCEGAFDPARMVQIGTPSASSFTALNLLPGHTYWFQVCALTTGNQQGPWSDPATGMAV